MKLTNIMEHYKLLLRFVRRGYVFRVNVIKRVNRNIICGVCDNRYECHTAPDRIILPFNIDVFDHDSKFIFDGVIWCKDFYVIKELY